jgi:ABC-type multidrug transport system fused ATPase/permease subunit
MNKHPIQPGKRPDRLLSYWTAQPWLCLTITLTGIVYNFGMLAFPYFESRLIDTVQAGESVAQIESLLALFLGAIALTQVTRMLKRYTVRRFANNAIASMRLNVYNNTLHLSPSELKDTSMGVFLNRVTSDVAAAVEGMRKLTTEIFDTCFVFLFYVAYLLLFDGPMTLLALLPVALAILAAFLLRKAIFKASAQARQASSRISGATYDLFDNALTYRIYGRDADNLSRYDATLSDYEKKAIRSSALADAMMPIASVIALIGLLPIILLGSRHVIAGDPLSVTIPGLLTGGWTVGELTAYITVFVIMAAKAAESAKLFGSIENGLASWKRIKPYISPYADYAAPKAVEDPQASLTLRDFGIRIQGRGLFGGVALTAKKNQILGVTGPIASGKTALGKAFLQGLPYEGSILLFGKELRDYASSEIAGTVAYMGHRNDLFTDTIENNVALGDRQPVAPYLEAVSFSEDLLTMPLGAKTLVGNEGVKLSGGQQERIALARTLYHKKALVVLDDPFASVDPATEKEIVARLRSELQGSLVLFISHRLTSFPDLDLIVVLNGDGTVSLGSHEELLANCPTYRNLYELQQTSGGETHE